MPELPVIGAWELYDPKFPGNAAWGNLAVDFKTNTVTLQYQQQTAQLTAVTRLSPGRFGGHYHVGRFQGLIEAEIQTDRTIKVKFLGTPNAECAGRPTGSALQWIAAEYKGSYDIAGAALAISRADVGIKWDNDTLALADALSLDKLFGVRRMCCYEFVHLAAYLAGQHPCLPGTKIPWLGCEADVFARHYDANKKAYGVWGGKSIIPRNKIVVGHATVPWKNSSTGTATGKYCHVAISLGDGRVIGVNSGTNLRIDTTKGTFGLPYYDDVRVGDYAWLPEQGDHQAPPPLVWRDPIPAEDKDIIVPGPY